CWGAGATFDYW
nr:immunoglobulin heavy chain junction region [Macaca mulatta]MOW23906.1 immunoglobulin heavy chain junction region [Macaca mulatta]MOW25457.1 immunoglobulin heavy chain junction region [Macaca mulatta]MOW26901.1 immunoglobulin heavy chain junction region [Macaca mulatta]